MKLWCLELSNRTLTSDFTSTKLILNRGYKNEAYH
jgi:hypothetical protein